MPVLLAASILLIVSHVVPSAPGIRERLVAGLGRGGFYAGYGMFSLLAMGLVVWSYRAVGPGDWLYSPLAGARPLAVFGMPMPIFLLVGRLTTPAKDEAMRGVYRITTVPGSLAILLWALLHLLNVGEDRTVVVFAAMAAIAAAAVIKNAVLAKRLWPAGSAVPGLALLSGRTRLAWQEIGWWRLALTGVLYATLLHLHPLVIGVDPLAGL